MIFQIILTISLATIGIYAVSVRQRAALVGNLSILISVIAMFFVWRPGNATSIAQYFGIGRGADLIFYCWVVIGLLLILNLHLRMRAQMEIITELVRQLAIMRPQQRPEVQKHANES